MAGRDLAAKALIEAHQTPDDGWQFFPVEIQHKDGSAYRDIYHVWWVHKKVGAIDPTSEGVKTVAGEIDGTHAWTHIGAKTPERLRVLKSLIAGLTAWKDFRYFPSRGIFHLGCSVCRHGRARDELFSGRHGLVRSVMQASKG